LTAGGTVTSAAGSVITAGNAGDATVISQNGSLNLDGLVTAATAHFEARTGITANTNVDNLSAVNNASGNILITETAGLTINGVGITNTGSGNVTVLVTAGDLTVDSDVDAEGNVELNSAAGLILVNAMVQGDDVDLRTGGGTITISATGS